MSRLRNRNIRTKIHAVAKWSNNFNATTTRVNTQTNGKLFENAGTTTTADSGIAEIVPLAPKLNKLVHTTRTRTRRSNWNLDSAVEESGNESSDEESRNSCSSVDTLKVLDEIRNLEDSVKSMSAESYNSWNEEYENDSTQLVKAEYDRMERVLQCREAIPANYDKEEYKLWIKTFPLLSLVSRTSSLEYRKTSPYDTLEQISTPKFCDTTPSTPAKKNSPVDNILDQLESFTTLKNQLPTHSTTTYTNKYLAINNTINPRTINIADQSFLQLAPVITNNHSSNRRQSFKPSHPREKSNTNCTGRTSDWLKDVHDFNHFRQGKMIILVHQGRIQEENHLKLNR
ncbi:uncharacterized protein [Atheta coriaria]|uniref:uncharacterized protein n=1 Tax=Dalotia coriaria TaxID=877792 RepID=UPI0031F3862E